MAKLFRVAKTAIMAEMASFANVFKMYRIAEKDGMAKKTRLAKRAMKTKVARMDDMPRTAWLV